jgi:RHS repeat-associated protein
VNGVDYDSDKNADTVEDGLDYDRSPSAAPNPPWEAGPPDGAVTMADVLAVQPQVGRNCIGAPEEASVTYGYDDNGNQTGRGADTFAYDHENRLTQAVIGGVTSSSTYNGDGLRMSHTVGAGTTNYTWDTSAELPVVLQDGASTYVYGLDLISTRDGAGTQTYHLYDGLGSTVGLVDEEGNPVDGYTYDVFGALRSQSGSSPSYWLFIGEQRASESSFYYLRARYYDPAVGRFLSQDPVFGGSTLFSVDTGKEA